MEDFIIVKEHPDMLVYVDQLQRKNAEALSFYPLSVFEREAAKGRIFLGLLNGQACGYIYIGSPNMTTVRVHQVCIEYDIRRLEYGAQLVVAVEDYALTHGSSRVLLRGGFELEANNFWEALGYQCVGIVDGGIRRQRKINLWSRNIQAALFEDTVMEPAVGKVDASVWRKHKQTGLVSSFARGKRLLEYRNQLIAASEIPEKINR